MLNLSLSVALMVTGSLESPLISLYGGCDCLHPCLSWIVRQFDASDCVAVLSNFCLAPRLRPSLQFFHMGPPAPPAPPPPPAHDNLPSLTHWKGNCVQCWRDGRHPEGFWKKGRCTREDCPQFYRLRNRDRDPWSRAAPPPRSTPPPPPPPSRPSPPARSGCICKFLK